MHWIIIAILFSIDIGSKIFAERKIKYNPKKLLKGKIELIYIRNYGIALNKLNYKKKLILFFNFILLIYISYLLESESYSKVGLSMIMAGGLGNALNRLYSGYVIDFIYFNIRKFPVFNIADFYIFIGMAILLYRDLF